MKKKFFSEKYSIRKFQGLFAFFFKTLIYKMLNIHLVLTTRLVGKCTSCQNRHQISQPSYFPARRLNPGCLHNREICRKTFFTDQIFAKIFLVYFDWIISRGELIMTKIFDGFWYNLSKNHEMVQEISPRWISKSLINYFRVSS